MKKILLLVMLCPLVFVACEKNDEKEKTIDYKVEVYSNNTYVGESYDWIKDFAPGVFNAERTSLGVNELHYKLIASNFDYTDTLYYKFEFKNNICQEMAILSLGYNQIQLMYDFTFNYHQLTSITSGIALGQTNGVSTNFNSIPELWAYISDNKLENKINFISIQQSTGFSTTKYINHIFYSGELDGFIFQQKLID